jgi:hypothetical protein
MLDDWQGPAGIALLMDLDANGGPLEKDGHEYCS